MHNFIKDTLQSLESDYGRWGLYVKQIIDNDPNVDNVQISESICRVKVIRLPNTFERTKASMTSGGNYDMGTRWFIIRTLPVEAHIEDKIRIDNKEYTIVSVETLDDNVGHLFKTTSKEEGWE